jgi:S-formylglutathione hydrolase FrmB
VRRVVIAALAVVAALAGAVEPAGAAPEDCVAPRCVDAQVPVPANLTVPDSRVRVILPEGYAEHPCRSYPVLYLLHGVGDAYTRWVENTDVVELTKQFPLIVVMPDGGRTPDAGWYSDWLDGSRQWETFHTDVLAKFVDTAFRTEGAGHRLIAGLSMGGFGTMSYAARHPGMFEAAASFSGAVDTMYGFPVSGPFFSTLHEQFGTPDDRVWGNQLTDEATWRAHNPTDLAASLHGTELFVASGTGTPGGPAGDVPDNPAAYGLESFIFQLNLSFARALTLAGVPFHQDFYPGGYHGWPYWQRELHWALPQLVPLVTTGQETTPCPLPTAAADAAVRAADRGRGGTLPSTGGTEALAPGLLALAAALAVSRRVRRAA